jgi:hypothetical protein
MDHTQLVILHLVGVFTLFSSLGAIMLGGSGRKGASMLHGISLIFILLVGFAMLKHPPMNQHWWQAKLLIWLFIGIAPALSKRKVLPGIVVLMLCLLLAGVAAWLGIRKPF